MVADGLLGGTVNIANGTLANEVTGRGINISGPFDVGTADPALGWIRPQGYPLRLRKLIPAGNGQQFWIGQGTILPKGGTWLGPMLQTPGCFAIEYCNGNFDISGFPDAGPAVRLGYSSELAAWRQTERHTKRMDPSYLVVIPGPA